VAQLVPRNVRTGQLETSWESELIMIAIKNVLVATDFSPASETAMMYGRALARTFEATLHVIYVVDNLAGRLAFGEAALAGSPLDLQADIEAAGRRSLEAAIAEDDRRELHAVPVLRTSTSPSKEIVNYAKEAKIDIVIVGTTGRGMLDRMLMGSVADKVVRTAPCPVLAVRNPEHEFVLPDALQTVARPNA
jgi:nucleotide-binding universal stress UspA family protein